MPWLRNNQATMSMDINDIYMQANNTVRTDFYRSRNPLDIELFSYIAMPFRLSTVPLNKQSIRNKFKTVAMPRGVTPDEAYGTVLSHIKNAAQLLYSSRHVLIVNTDSNQAVTPHIIQELKEQGWTEHDYRTALTSNPFHQVSVLRAISTSDIVLTEGHIVVFTNTITDEFILKLGAILPTLYGFTIPDAMINAFLNGDKAVFITAFTTEEADIIINRRRAEQYQQLHQLEQWLLTSDTTRLDNDIASKNRAIQDHESRLRQTYQALNQLLIQKASTFWGEADNRVTEFINYLKEYDSEKITRIIIDLGQDRFSVQLITELGYWDEELFKNYDKASRSNCVTNQTPQVRALLRNIFIDRSVKVVFHTAICIHFRNGYAERYNDFLQDGNSVIGIPHTHIYHHDCWGNNRGPLEKAFNDRNYLIAWEQIKATLSGLNVSDSTVFDKFVNRYMAGCNTPCLILKGTGEKLSPTQFVRKYPEGWVPAPVNPTPADTQTIEVPAPEAPVRRRRVAPVPEAPVNPEPVDDNPFDF